MLTRQKIILLTWKSIKSNHTTIVLGNHSILRAVQQIIWSFTEIDTYEIGHYNPLVKIPTKLLTPYMLCMLTLYMPGRDLEFKVDSGCQISEKLFLAILLHSQNFCQKSADSKSPKKYVFKFRFDIWFVFWTVVSHVISRYITYLRQRKQLKIWKYGLCRPRKVTVV